jgi:hypothetical protein
MSEHGHCPFLNRTDKRCGEHLNLESLDHAFEHCFDVYAACPVYLELLIERRTRGETDRPALQVVRPVVERMRPNVSRVVQVTVRRSLAGAGPAAAYRHP